MTFAVPFGLPPIKPHGPVAINFSHPIARNLIGLWPFTENEGETVADLNPPNYYNGPLTKNANGQVVWKNLQLGLGTSATGVSHTWLTSTGIAVAPVPRIEDPFSVMLVLMDRQISPGTFLSITRSGVGATPLFRFGHDDTGFGEIFAETQNGANTRHAAIVDFVVFDPMVLIATSDDSRLRIYAGSGQMAEVTAPGLGTNGNRLRLIQLNGLKPTVTDPDDPAHGEPMFMAMWDRVLGESEAAELLAEPYCLVTPDGWTQQPDLRDYAAYYRRLPCFDFGARRLFLKPIQQTDPTGGIIHAAKANRIDGHRVEIRLSLLDAAEQQALRDAWADGAGAVDPFWMTLPGETSIRRFVFDVDRLEISQDRPTAASARVLLRDVTRPGDPP